MATPHRFLPGYRKKEPSTKDAKRSAAFEAAVDRQPADHETHPASQFAPTPRFTHAHPRSSGQALHPQSPARSSFVEALKASARPAEDVQDGTSGSDDDEMLDNGQDCAWPTIESAKDQQWKEDLALSPKRRRLNDGQEAAPAQGFKLNQPQTPGLSSTDRISRHGFFQEPATATTPDVATTQRPMFSRATAHPSEPTEPVPEIFSPHRRGQKFLAGGMAATVQQWVLETGQNAVQSRRGQGYLQGEEYVMRVTLDGSVEGNGPFTACGQTSTGEAIYLLLTGGSSAGSMRKHDFRVGMSVGIRAPVWDLQLEGKTWTVAVDWRVLP